MRILHTADWHLGARLVDYDRLPEQRAFLDWLFARIEACAPELLIVAGDIFDSPNPPQEALALYYGFLARLAFYGKCRCLILGGNHDSPATLQAPRPLLAALRIDVLGSIAKDAPPALHLFDRVVICAVPFLRERDVRQAAPGQSFDEVAAAIRTGIHEHYRTAFLAAQAIAASRPIIATGHLTALGSQVSPSERAIHIGNLGAVEAACFDGFAYTALGHIHRPQVVGGHDHIRYAGSPIPLSFAEAGQTKEIRLLEIEGSAVHQQSIAIPVFRPLLRLTTTAKELAQDLIAAQASAGAELEPWVELTVSDAHAHPDIDRQVREAAKDLRLQVLKLIAPIPAEASESAADDPWRKQLLRDLEPAQVFAERLRRSEIPEDSEQGKELSGSFAELLSSMHESAAAEATAPQ